MSKDKNTANAPASLTARMNAQNQKDNEGWDKAFPDYPIYAYNDDIYHRGQKVTAVNPENFAENNEPHEASGTKR